VLEAKGGEFLGEGQWRLTGVVRTVLGDLKTLRQESLSENARSRVEHEDEMRWTSALSPDIIAVLMIAPERMSIIDLVSYLRHLSSNNQSTSRYDIALWKKFFYPAAALVMMALALPFAVHHSRVGGISLQIFGGVMIGVVFHLLNALFSSLGVLHDWPPFASALAPSALFLLAAAGMIWRVERR
jgi:lipopolysaccharide export system permease protein